MLEGSYIKGLTQISNQNEWEGVFFQEKGDTQWKPSFYSINPILLITYLPETNPIIYLPPYGKEASDYAESLAFIDYKFYIINKTGAGYIAVKTYGSKIKVKGGNGISQSSYNILNGTTTVLTGSIESDGSFYWVAEKGSISQEVSNGTIDIKRNDPIFDKKYLNQFGWKNNLVTPTKPSNPGGDIG